MAMDATFKFLGIERGSYKSALHLLLTVKNGVAKPGFLSDEDV